MSQNPIKIENSQDVFVIKKSHKFGKNKEPVEYFPIEDLQFSTTTHPLMLTTNETTTPLVLTTNETTTPLMLTTNETTTPLMLTTNETTTRLNDPLPLAINQSNDSLSTIFTKIGEISDRLDNFEIEQQSLFTKINEIFDRLDNFEIDQQSLKRQFNNLQDTFDNKQTLLKRKFSDLENEVQSFLKKRK
ncbi:hypothetical protein F8M41_017166 [Gigaspora margarita]|uniref:Uncharacterized protein n=1 Tax=Gigaspora margarita TaxID=4874 RepID=A0A8H4ANF3_GIGMA|nr:hypothetical protein F8M41_017166 [Gigaspora margarita]